MIWKKLLLFSLSGGILYLFLLLHPNLIFAEKYEYRGFSIHSDQRIPSDITTVVDDAIKRLKKSELYKQNQEFDVYLCNAQWKFTLLTRNSNAGGVVNFMLSPNIFLRESDIQFNRIVPPPSWKNSLADRPLSYFIAHEAVHSLQRQHNRFLIFNTPVEIVEGYAEYVAKSTTNSLTSLIEDYKAEKSTMDPNNGLYDKYNLYVGYLLERKNYDFEMLLKEKPAMEEVLRELEAE